MIEKDAILAIGNSRLRRLATYASVSVATILILAKLIGYFMTDSVAMLSSLLDSTIDLLSSLVTVYGVASALRPPDHDHRFGHGKAEPLAALAQAAFIVGSSVLLVYEALSRLYHPHVVQHEGLGYGVMALAIALTLVLVTFQKYAVYRTSSMAINADFMHYLGDLLVNIAVAVAFGLHQWTGLDWFDPVFAMGIGCGLVLTALHIARRALDVLMDHELPDADRTKIKDIVRAYPEVRGVHDMRTRSDSDRVFIEMHVEFDGDMQLRTSHQIIDAIEESLQKAYPNADILIHQDPVGLKEDRLDQHIEAQR